MVLNDRPHCRDCGQMIEPDGFCVICQKYYQPTEEERSASQELMDYLQKRMDHEPYDPLGTK